MYASNYSQTVSCIASPREGGGLIPTFILNSPLLPSYDTTDNLVLEPPQGQAHAGVNHTHLQPKEKNCLNHRLEKVSQHPRVWPFLYQDPRQTIPFLPWLCNDTEVSWRPYARKDRYVLACISSTSILPRFCSSPLAHWTVLGWRTFKVKAVHGTNISQRGHRGCGRFTSSRMITVSHTCRCRKCTCSLICITNLPWHTSTGKTCGPNVPRKEITYVCGYPLGGGGGWGWGLPLGSNSNTVLGLAVCHELPWHQIRSTVRELNPQPLAGSVGDSTPHHPYITPLTHIQDEL